MFVLKKKENVLYIKIIILAFGWGKFQGIKGCFAGIFEEGTDFTIIYTGKAIKWLLIFKAHSCQEYNLSLTW